MSIETAEALQVLKQAMEADTEPGSYAHSWHCNIAMMCYDAQMSAYEGVEDMIHDDIRAISNDAASRFMKLCFDVETKD